MKQSNRVHKNFFINFIYKWIISPFINKYVPKEPVKISDEFEFVENESRTKTIKRFEEAFGVCHADIVQLMANTNIASNNSVSSDKSINLRDVSGDSKIIKAKMDKIEKTLNELLIKVQKQDKPRIVESKPVIKRAVELPKVADFDETSFFTTKSFEHIHSIMKKVEELSLKGRNEDSELLELFNKLDEEMTTYQNSLKLEQLEKINWIHDGRVQKSIKAATDSLNKHKADREGIFTDDAVREYNQKNS